MSERVARLRKQSLDARPTISTERAELLTEFYRQHLGPVSAPVHRALAFRYLMEHKAVCINEGELIVQSLESLDYLNDPEAYAKKEQLKAMRICADVLIRFAERHAEKAQALAEQETDPQRKQELERIAAVCSYVPAHPPDRTSVILRHES